jgi:hypothetical protein
MCGLCRETASVDEYFPYIGLAVCWLEKSHLRKPKTLFRCNTVSVGLLIAVCLGFWWKLELM